MVMMMMIIIAIDMYIKWRLVDISRSGGSRK
jgi:hypothetical protein